MFIITGVLLFLAAGFQAFGLSLLIRSLVDSGAWTNLLFKALVILALCVLAFFSIRAGRNIINGNV